ncbi:vitamin K epoxide reductase family protein [Microbacterium sp. NPDC091313]
MSTPHPSVSTPAAETRHPVLAVWLIIAGVVGEWAAFSLTTERLHLLENPGSTASCDFSVLIQCGKNLDSWQGSLFGFPNPLIGLICWSAPIVVGVAMLAGARFARWFWWLFTLGVTGAMAFVIWLISQSLYSLATLCPWCMVTWSVTIPTFYAVWVHVLREGIVPASAGVRRAANALVSWIPLMAILSFALIAVLAQLQLNVLGTL